MPAFDTLLSGYSFFEGPRWHDGRLWLSDFYTHQVIACDLQGRVEKIADVPGQPSGLGWLPDGRLLIVSMRDRRVLRREADGQLVTHADLSNIATGHCNDMAVDAQGRAWVGNFGFDLMGGGGVQTASLARVDPDGSVHEAARELYFPNAILPTPDGRIRLVPADIIPADERPDANYPMVLITGLGITALNSLPVTSSTSRVSGQSCSTRGMPVPMPRYGRMLIA